MALKFLKTAEIVRVPWQSRVTRLYNPSYIIIHATRGPAASTGPKAHNQYEATRDWFRRAGIVDLRLLGQDWGPTADILIGDAGEVAVFETAEQAAWIDTRSQWSAGYGVSDEYPAFGADEYGVSIEIAQSAAQEPFTPAAIDALVPILVELCVRFDIPAKKLLSLDQSDRNAPKPRGIVGHEHTENGKRTGKSDPGFRFPWFEVLERVRKGIADKTAPPPPPAPTPPSTPPVTTEPWTLDEAYLHITKAFRPAYQFPNKVKYNKPIRLNNGHVLHTFEVSK